MALPQRIPLTPDAAVATYDFFDLGTGKGIAVLNAGMSEGPVYNLGKREFYSHDIGTSATNAALDIDFDVTFLKPIIIEGSTIVNVTVSARTISGGPLAISVLVTATLRHWDGTTETDLASDTHTLVNASAADGTGVNKLISFDLDIARRHFAIGETLRLTIEAANPGTTREVRILHDPKNRTTTVYKEGGTENSVSSKCELHLPIVTFI